MIDKSHCLMNMEDEDEYVDFYDFSKTYVNHPLLIKDAASDNSIKEEKESAEKEGDGWEDCDEEDISSGEEEEESTDSFQIVNKEGQSSESFTVVDKTTESAPASEEKKSKKSDSWAIDSMSSIKSDKAKKGKGTGVSREDAFLGLKIKKAELLPSGEVKLGNGKIMGHRQFHYIYKQKPRLPDERESVVINKIALEYRRLRALQNGGRGDALFAGQLTKKEFKNVIKERFLYEKGALH